ncbi:MAG: GNAT family N-acetyltransferase [Cellvibrionaceae bacterium]
MIKIKQAHASDASTISSLTKSLLIEIEPNHTRKIESTNYEAVVTSLLEDKVIHIFLAYMNATPAGFITINQCASLYAEGYFGEISELYIKPEWRNMKFGRQLVARAKSLAVEKNWKSLEVGTPPDENSEAARRFYTQNGFSYMGSRMGCYLQNS